MEGAKLQFLKDEGALEQMWNLSCYKKAYLTHMTHYSFHFSREREKVKEREIERGARVSKGREISSLKNFNLK